eukprot:Sspe_Gene.30356::Locus_15022_Transcript_1_1_Confidence_1.000_Length_3051::g.30356::m.30356
MKAPLLSSQGSSPLQSPTASNKRRSIFEDEDPNSRTYASLLGATVFSEDDKAQPDDQVVINQLLKFLLVDMEKRNHFRHLPFYLLFLILITVLVFLSLHSLRHMEYSDPYHLHEEVKSLVLYPTLMEVASGVEMWPWLNAAMAKVWTDGRGAVQSAGSVRSGDGSCNATASSKAPYALGVVKIRQWRVEEYRCHLGIPGVTAIPPSERAVLPCSCSPPWSSPSSAPFGVWEVDPLPNPTSIQTPRHTFDGPQFTETFPFTLTPPEVESKLLAIRRQGWLDTSTRLVSLDVLFFNADSELFVRMACYVEFFQTGATEPGCHSRLFEIRNLSRGYDTLIFTLDILVAVSGAIMAVSIVREVTRNYRVDPHNSPVGVWLLFEILHEALLILTFYYRFTLWTSGQAMSSDGFYEDHRAKYGSDEEVMFFYMSAYAEYDYEAANCLSLVVVFSYIRVFKYFQHFSVLNMLSETVKRCFSDILRLAIILGFVLAGYAICATILYSPYLPQFETFLHSGSWLLRVVFMQYEFEWEPLRNAHPIITPLFMGTFYALCFFLLLNMVLAVVVSAFEHVRSAQEKADNRRQKRAGDRLDEELERLRESSTHAAPSKAPRLMRRATTVLERVYARVTTVLLKILGQDKCNNSIRKQTMEVVKEYCGRKLEVPVRCLEEKPEYYSRLAITMLELQDLAGGLLSGKDIDRIFEGAQRRATEQENLQVILSQSIADLSKSIDQRFTALEKNMSPASLETENRRLVEVNNDLRKRLELWRPPLPSKFPQLGTVEQERQWMKKHHAERAALLEQEKKLATTHAGKVSALVADKERLAARVAELQAERDSLTSKVRLQEKVLYHCWVSDKPPSKPQSPLSTAGPAPDPNPNPLTTSDSGSEADRLHFEDANRMLSEASAIVRFRSPQL